MPCRNACKKPAKTSRQIAGSMFFGNSKKSKKAVVPDAACVAWHRRPGDARLHETSGQYLVDDLPVVDVQSLTPRNRKTAWVKTEQV